MLSEPAQRYLEKLSLVLHQTTQGVSNYAHKAQVIDSLMIAVEDRRTALISYQSLTSAGPITHELHAYGLVFHLGSLYLVANSALHHEIRHFKIDRIIGVELLDSRFEKPVEFRLQDHIWQIPLESSRGMDRRHESVSGFQPQPGVISRRRFGTPVKTWMYKPMGH